MNCEAFRRAVYALVDGELPPAMQESAEAHLAGCEACRKIHLSEKSLRDCCGRLAVEEAPAELRDRVRAACRGAGVTSAPAAVPRRRGRLLRTWALTCTAVAAAASAILLLTPPRVQVRTAFAAEHERFSSAQIDLAIDGGAAGDFGRRFCEALGQKMALPDVGHNEILGGEVLRLSGRRVGVFVCRCPKRKIRMTYFVARTRDLNLSGMREIQKDGRAFHVGAGCDCGEGGECDQCGCQVVAWRAGEFTYAVALKGTEKEALEAASHGARVLPGR